MKRRKPIPPTQSTSDPRFTIRGTGFNVQQLPPSGRSPKRRISHSTKYRPSSVQGTVVPMLQRAPGVKFFFGLGGGVRFRK